MVPEDHAEHLREQQPRTTTKYLLKSNKKQSKQKHKNLLKQKTEPNDRLSEQRGRGGGGHWALGSGFWVLEQPQTERDLNDKQTNKQLLQLSNRPSLYICMYV